MSENTLDEIMRGVRVVRFGDLNIGDEFISAPLSDEELNSEKPFNIFKKIKRNFGIHGQHNVKRRIDGTLSHIPDSMPVILLDNIPEGIATQ